MPRPTVTLVGRDVRFPVEPGETILAAAERAGVPWVSGCQSGACLTCAARLVRGRVDMPQGTALTPRMLEAHVILPCVATVTADTYLVVGKLGRTLLHPRHLKPWTD